MVQQLMDEDLSFNLDEVLKSIDKAEVISLFFPKFRKSMIIDTRSNDTDGPMVRIMPMVASPQERMRNIRRLRPSFPRLRDLTLLAWPRYVESLVNLGVWDRILARLRDLGHEDAVASCEELFSELKRLEKAELAAVVQGENYHTIWSAPR